MPHAPLTMLPVTGLPSQVTVQSTPALLLSPTGIMLNFTGEPMARVVAFTAVPLELVIAIGPAVAFVVETLPQPEVTAARTVRNRT